MLKGILLLSRVKYWTYCSILWLAHSTPFCTDLHTFAWKCSFDAICIRVRREEGKKETKELKWASMNLCRSWCRFTRSKTLNALEGTKIWLRCQRCCFLSDWYQQIGWRKILFFSRSTALFRATTQEERRINSLQCASLHVLLGKWGTIYSVNQTKHTSSHPFSSGKGLVYLYFPRHASTHHRFSGFAFKLLSLMQMPQRDIMQVPTFDCRLQTSQRQCR